MHDDGSRVEIDPSLDKLHIDEHVARIAPTLIDLTGEFAADLAAARIESRAYQRVIRRVFIYWQQSEQVCNLETWPDFSARARQSICRIAGQGKRGEITVVVSSGVLIAAITRFVLNLPDSATYGLFEAVKNCSITHLLHSGPRLSLSSFNDTTYLSAIGSGRTGTNLITYR